MKILSAQQIREADKQTIEQEPIASFDLMERAADVFTRWLINRYPNQNKFVIYAGKGNNGGDGLAVARILKNQYQKDVNVYILEHREKATEDFSINLKRLSIYYITCTHISNVNELVRPDKDSLIIDALLGTGIQGPIHHVLLKSTIDFINNLPNTIVSIDVPSGLLCDSPTQGAAIEANLVGTFEFAKTAFLIPENYKYVKDFAILPIQLQHEKILTKSHFVTEDMAQKIYRSSNKFDHKGSNGHALIIAGKPETLGAALLCSQSCLRSGAGKVTCYSIAQSRESILAYAPEVMVLEDNHPIHISRLPNITTYQAIGIGPGIGTSSETVKVLEKLLRTAQQPLLLDADALNILAAKPDLLKHLPLHTILTPHLKEFEKMFGKSNNSFDRLDLAKTKAAEYGCIIVLKGAHTAIALPNGEVYFNSTGNAGLATAGSGDVLSGIITALLAKAYQPWQAAVLGAFIHGLAGDLGLSYESKESLIASDIISTIGAAYNSLQR